MVQKYAHDSKEVYKKLLKRWEDFVPIYKVEEEGVDSISQFTSVIKNFVHAPKLSPEIPELSPNIR